MVLGIKAKKIEIEQFVDNTSQEVFSVLFSCYKDLLYTVVHNVSYYIIKSAS